MCFLITCNICSVEGAIIKCTLNSLINTQRYWKFKQNIVFSSTGIIGVEAICSSILPNDAIRSTHPYRIYRLEFYVSTLNFFYCEINELSLNLHLIFSYKFKEWNIDAMGDGRLVSSVFYKVTRFVRKALNFHPKGPLEVDKLCSLFSY